MIPPHPDHPSADEPLSGDPAAGTNDEPGRFTAPGEVVFVRQLPGPIERVWAFLTEPGKRARWLAGGPMELRVGGRVELQFRRSRPSRCRRNTSRAAAGAAAVMRWSAR